MIIAYERFRSKEYVIIVKGTPKFQEYHLIARVDGDDYVGERRVGGLTTNDGLPILPNIHRWLEQEIK